MKTAAWMVGAALVAWGGSVLLFGPQNLMPTLLGMAGPLVITVSTWLLAEQTYRRDPTALTGLMIDGFVGKMVFFGGYVAAITVGLKQPVVPFCRELYRVFHRAVSDRGARAATPVCCCPMNARAGDTDV